MVFSKVLFKLAFLCSFTFLALEPHFTTPRKKDSGCFWSLKLWEYWCHLLHLFFFFSYRGCIIVKITNLGQSLVLIGKLKKTSFNSWNSLFRASSPSFLGFGTYQQCLSILCLLTHFWDGHSGDKNKFHLINLQM